MKKLKPVLILLLLLTAQVSFAQKIRFTDTTNKWRTYWTGKPPMQSYNSYGWVKDTVINSLSYRYLNYWWVREDTTAGRVYYLRDDYSEEILYDYNLKKGDTLNCMFLYITTPQYYRHYVKKVDSTLIQGVYHKVWEFAPTKLTGQPQGAAYVVIEGIGCTNAPWRAMRPYYDLWAREKLICFTTQGNIVTAQWPASTTTGIDTLINSTTCVLSVATTPATTAGNATVVPNPADETTIIYLAKPIQAGRLTIVNSMGQIVAQLPVTQTDKLHIGQYLQAGGIYYYSIADYQRQEHYSGKLICE